MRIGKYNLAASASAKYTYFHLVLEPSHLAVVWLIHIGVETGGAGWAIAPPIFLEGGLSPLHLQPSIVTIQTF